MKNISLREHIAQSKIAVAANRAKGNRHGQILSMLYSDPFHFIEELIQNAEDAIARKKNPEGPGCVKIIIDEAGISFLHNGDPFTEADLMSITTYAATTKKGLPGINQIGKFGIGFRSVFGLTDLPEIHSGNHHYKISDFEVLEETKPVELQEFDTLIRIPFKSSVSEDFRIQLQNKICSLNPNFLLFLNQIAQVEIIAGNQSVVFSSDTEVFAKNLTIKNIISCVAGKRDIQRYFLFSRNAGRNKDAAVAFAIDDANHFVPVATSVASVFFPTQLRIAHHFLIHGSFTTTPNRENIPFSEEWTPENKSILSVLSDLMRISFRQLLNSKLISADFWQLFSWQNASADPISEIISTCLKNLIEEEKCLLDSNGKMHAVAGLCIPEEDALLQLVSGREIAAIYSRAGFLHPSINANESFVVHLKKNHKLKLADIDSFAFFIGNHPGFLQKKPLVFYTDFYRFLAAHPRLWDLTHRGRYYNLRHKAIIPDKGRRLIVPFSENDKPQIFIGKATNGFFTVHPELAQDADCMNFFAMLGIPDFAPGLSEADILLHRFHEKKASSWWLKLYQLYASTDEHVRERIRDKVSEINCLPCIESQTNNQVFVKPRQAYFPDKYLNAYLAFHRSFFVHTQLLLFVSKHEIPASLFRSFLQELGVNTGLRISKAETTLSDDQKTALRAGSNLQPLVRENICDYTIDGIESILSHPVPTASAALWNLLGSVSEKYRKASYTFESYVRSETATFQTSFIRQLSESKWLFDEQLNIISPSGLSIEKLHPYFQQAHPESLWMAEELGMTAGSISVEEKEMLTFIRQNKLNAFTLHELVERNNADTTFIKYSPLKQNTAIDPGTSSIALNDLRTLSKSLSFLPVNTLSWDQCLFDEKAKLLLHQLITHQLSESKTLQAAVAEPGHVKIYDGLLVLTHYFAAVRPASGEPVLLPSCFAAHWSEQPGRQDTGLFVFSLGEKICEEVSPGNFLDFIRNSQVAYITPTTLLND